MTSARLKRRHSGQGPSVLCEQISLLSHRDRAVRYWAALGILAQGDAGRPAAPTLRRSVADPIPSVRIAAAQALIAIEDSKAALDAVTQALNHPHPLVALPAANALDHLGAKAKPALPTIKAYLGRTPDKTHTGWQFPRWVLRRTVERF